jgi:hypothetical protein
MSEGHLTPDDVRSIATEIINQVHEQKHTFWINPERHYKDHAKVQKFSDDDIHSLADLAKAWRSARGLFWKAFLGLAILGSLAMVAVGFGFKSGG